LKSFREISAASSKNAFKWAIRQRYSGKESITYLKKLFTFNTSTSGAIGAGTCWLAVGGASTVAGADSDAILKSYMDLYVGRYVLVY